MKRDVLTISGKKDGDIELPNVFETEVNRTLIHKAYINLESHGFQKHSTKPTAGMEVVADSNDPPTGRGVARIAKIKGGGGGRAGQAGEVASTRGGRQAHPPKANKVIYKKLNINYLELNKLIILIFILNLFLDVFFFGLPKF